MTPPPAHALVCVLIALFTAGCADDGDFTVATNRPASDFPRIEAEVRKIAPEITRIRWILLAPGESPSVLLERRQPPDMILCDLVEQESGKTSVFNDPRHDSRSLVQAEQRLRRGDWAAGYAQLVRAADTPSPPARRLGSAFAPGSVFEGVSVVPSSMRGLQVAQEFRNPIDARSVEASPLGTEADSLLADLLGSTLIDSRDELRAAWSALESADHPARLEMWMTQPPPWPPASVAKLLAGGSNGMAMLETLAGQVAPEPATRAWLIRSWLAPGRTVDGRLFNEIADAVDGRLVREPRFRAWLRSEWTAWARQRYRRVARQAAVKGATS